MTRPVWRLLAAFPRQSWQAAVFVFVASLLMSSALAVPIVDARGWSWFDLIRLMVLLLVVTRSLSGREIVSLPVSRKDLWRARWLAATVGVTAISALGRLAFALGFGRWLPFDLATEGGLAAVDFLTASAWVGCAAVLLRGSVRHEPRWSWQVRRGAALVLGLSLPVWSPYVRFRVLDSGLRATPVEGALVAALAALGLVGFWLVPPVHLAGTGNPATGLSDRAGRVHTADVASAHACGRPGRGVAAWVWREIGRALLASVGTVVATAVASAVAFGTQRPWWTAGVFVPYPTAAAVLTPAVLAYTWADLVIRRAGMLRHLPISTWTIATLLTAGTFLVLLLTWVIDALAYRSGFGAWPVSFELPTLAALAVVTGIAKTVGLAFNRSGVFVVFSGLLAGLLGFVVADPVAPGLTSTTVVVTAAAGVLMALIGIDVVILARTRRIYRPRPAVA